jgi:tetratricopeptide (TPR) repeat protein
MRTCADRIADVAHVLAMHFDLGQLPVRAVHYYMMAGQLTARRFASADALVSYERALELLPRMPAARERDVLELRILGIVGQLLIRSKPGRGRDPLGRYQRAIEIARRLDDVPGLYAGLAHLRFHCVIVADHARATEIGEELAQLAASQPLDRTLIEYGTNARAIAAAYRGDLATAMSLFDAIIASTTSATAGSATAGEGIVDEARMIMLWSEQRTHHEPAVIEALVASYRRRLERVSAATLVALPLIDLLRTSGEVGVAHEIVEAAIDFATTRDERLYLPELLRLRGLLVAATDTAAAVRAYQEAAELARAFGLPSLELRTATALASVSDGALARLAEVAARFGDGDHTPDLAEARAVLARARPVPEPTGR